MKCLKLEIIEWDDKEQRRQCFALCDRCKQMTNRIWQLWEYWHLEQESPQRIRDYLAALKLWRESGLAEPAIDVADSQLRSKVKSFAKAAYRRGNWRTALADCLELPAGLAVADTRLAVKYLEDCERVGFPILRCVAVDAGLSNVIYRTTSDEFPDLSSRTRVLLQNTLAGKIGKLKGAKGSLSGWMRILLCDDRRPASIDPVPVPFDAANCKVSVAEGVVCVGVRLERHVADGKTQGASDVWSFRVKTDGKAKRYAAPIFAVAEGRHKLKGSSLFYDSKRRKWYMLVAYEPAPEPKPLLDANRVAILRPACRRPFTLRIAGWTRWLGDRGRAIAHRRQAILAGRWSRQENYRYAAGNRKGHGRGHALSSIEKLERSWKMFCKTYNETIGAEAIARCVEAGCGRLLFLRPRRPRFLETAGKFQDRNDASSWPWYGLETYLRRKCAALGIELIEQRQRVKQTAVA